MLEHIFPILIIIVLLVALGTYLLIKIPNAYPFKWVAIPVFLVGAFFSYQIYDRMLGYAYPVPIPAAFQFLDYRVVRGDDGAKKIEIWIVDADKRSRLHLIPWSSQTEKQLKEAKKRGQDGTPQVGKKVPKKKEEKDGADGKGSKKGDKKKGRDDRGGMWDFDLELYNLPFEVVAPKTDNVTPVPQPATPDIPTTNDQGIDNQ